MLILIGVIGYAANFLESVPTGTQFNLFAGYGLFLALASTNILFLSALAQISTGLKRKKSKLTFIAETLQESS